MTGLLNYMDSLVILSPKLGQLTCLNTYILSFKNIYLWKLSQLIKNQIIRIRMKYILTLLNFLNRSINKSQRK
jgi:hypothetical protein